MGADTRNADVESGHLPTTYRTATSGDAVAIRAIYEAAFEEAEREPVAELAVALLHEASASVTFSDVAECGGQAIGHAAWSPLVRATEAELVGYVLAPLAVMPAAQGRGAGSALVVMGLERLRCQGVALAFVYGDPKYYGRFGFVATLAQSFVPPFPLQHPQGWQALYLGCDHEVPQGGAITCVPALRDPELW